jgi:hypothetical protein
MTPTIHPDVLREIQAEVLPGETPTERLHRVALNMDIVKAIPQQPQIQASLADQLDALRVLALKFGLRDTLDFLPVVVRE